MHGRQIVENCGGIQCMGVRALDPVRKLPHFVLFKKRLGPGPAQAA